MGKTLFSYIFLDLLRIFLLASMALAGIMSFAGLLRPLTQHNLDGAQVMELLGYFLPAMTNYSWPVAALFATTFVYGRLSADNELTACRAAGMGWFALYSPAILLGLIVSLFSLMFLWFVVPWAFLRAEIVVKSNLAQLVAAQIEQTQRVNLDLQGRRTVIFAKSADVMDVGPDQPSLQAVRLNDVVIADNRPTTLPTEPLIPESFFTASSATILITQPTDDDNDVQVTVRLEEGAKLPVIAPELLRGERAPESRDVVRAAIATQIFGPYPLPSPVREQPSFMDVRKLLQLQEKPELGRRVNKLKDELVRFEQQSRFLSFLERQFTTDSRSVALEAPNETLVITAGKQKPQWRDYKLQIVAGDEQAPGIIIRQVKGFEQFSARARLVRFEVLPDRATGKMTVSLDMEDAVIETSTTEIAHRNLNRRLTIDMPEDLRKLDQTPVAQYIQNRTLTDSQRGRLNYELIRQNNGISSELHSRVAFAFSSLVLVAVGASLGMQLKSGNFITAFAVSVVPALICIVLIVTGKQVSQNIPREIPENFVNPIALGLTIMWAGNALVLGAGSVLIWRQRAT
jgi:lipopolysaccharide export LptBFGC system permease protein LptF